MSWRYAELNFVRPNVVTDCFEFEGIGRFGWFNGYNTQSYDGCSYFDGNNRQ